jgi:hypothetical protein
MKHCIIVPVGPDEFSCKSFYDVEASCGGIEIYLNENYVGEMLDITLPDAEDKDEVEKFSNEVEKYIETTYYGIKNN